MSNWDRILSSAPLNREAAVVTGESREPVGFRKPIDDQYLQDGPHPLRPIPPHPNFTDLTGQRFGTLTVRGLAADFKQNSGGSPWAVRCDCGAYTMRRSQGLTRGHTIYCAECDYRERVKAGLVSVEIERRTA